MLLSMAARTRATDKRTLERLHERIKTGDRGWFFANIADKVSEQRLARKLSQRELAELCGTTQSAIARLERGGRPPRIDTLLRIAEALDCDLHVDLEEHSEAATVDGFVRPRFLAQPLERPAGDERDRAAAIAAIDGVR